jgi:hypothetical protein
VPNYIDGRLQERDYPTFVDLDSIITILGSTRTVLFPFIESVGQVVQSYEESVHDLTPSDGAARDLEAEFIPYKHSGGVHSYFIDRSVNNHLAVGADHDDFSAISGGVDAAFSVGAWCLPRLAGTQQALFAKYDVAGGFREWQLFLNASEEIQFELFDESIADANAAVTAPGATALTVNEWAFVVATYGGQGGAPGFAGSSMTLAVYLNGVDDTGTVAGSGGDDYEDTENTATIPLVGAADDSAGPTFEWEGRIALPFVCGKELSAGEVSQLYGLGRRLLGLA